MTDTKVLDESTAWQANKPMFAAPPIIFPEIAQQLLGEIQSNIGLHERMEAFFNELYHPFPDANAVVKGYRSLALQDSWAFHDRENTSELVRDMVELGLYQLRMKFPYHERERIISTILELLEREISRGFLNGDDSSYVISELTVIVRDDDIFAGRASGKIKKLWNSVNNNSEIKGIEGLLKISLERSIYCWSKEGNENWYSSFGSIKLITVMDEFFQLMNDYKNQLENSMDVPDSESIARLLLQKIRSEYELLAKIELILALFDFDYLKFYQTELLNHLTMILRRAPLGNEPQKAIEVFNLLFPFLAKLGHDHFVVINSILVHLGKQVIPAGNTDIIDYLCQKIISLPFPDPQISGVNSDWQILRNPAHLPTIRTILEIIRIDPEKTTILLAGLHINLRAGGVFISDTDLFHHDVSELLNSNIKPVYKQLKQLCRLFPVFFRDIGAEGELRTASTKIDEMYGRSDKLIHFLRKQIHIESNNTQIDLLRGIVEKWCDNSEAGLSGRLPDDVLDFLKKDETYLKKASVTCEILKQVVGFKTPEELLDSDPDELLEICTDGELDERVARIVRIYQLLSAKYDLDSAGARDALMSLRILDTDDIVVLFDAIDAGDNEKSIDIALDIMAQLSGIIHDPEKSEIEERIYRKRHIAAGIPSMYGHYEEKKLECLGASYRLERLISLLLENLISGIDLDYITRPALRKIEWILERLIRALELDGIRIHDLRSHCDMLKSALQKEGFTINQFLNIFQVFGQRVRGIIDRYFYAFHKDAMGLIMPARCEDPACQTRVSEMVMRDILSSAFGVGILDNFLGKIIGTLADMRLKLQPETVNLVLSFDADKSLLRLHEVPGEMANPVWLGNKGYNLYLLRKLGIRVPWGFAVTTEVYRCRKAFDSYPYMKAALRRRLISEIQNLEELSGYLLGRTNQGRPPLLLSVRSGAAVSMPGVMMTFLNVGMNRDIAMELSRLPNYAWTAWDCYRRMIQLWGMAYGIERDEFDDIINNMKRKHEVDAKLEFSPANMASIADAYMALLNSRGINIPEDPLEQVVEAIELVFSSWDSHMAGVYREQFDIAEEWGTAVLIQRMILGNLNFDSGTGVAMVKVSGNKLTLSGDFVPHSQGEDVVSGLVYPFPVSEVERISRQGAMSLEGNYPMHFNALMDLGKNLIIENDFPEQEIEFTFEDSNPDNLYVLQCRTLVSGHGEKIAVFTDAEEHHTPLTIGVGAGGGAFVGRAVFSRESIDLLKEESDIPLILVRPDTVPDDVDMIFACQGLLTARGGITSHAAVTANRLGKVCVVNCRDLNVYDDERKAICGGREIHEGDIISIDGNTGKIFMGQRPVSSTSSRNIVLQLA
ncbi:MAG: hypothetical protein JXR95_07130 [Deltaproteobacteria bacterium]|nr:hypothetical protein [Deltaproteobacteria bacterium]